MSRAVAAVAERVARFLGVDDVSAVAAAVEAEDARIARVLGLDPRGGRDRREYRTLVRAEAERRVTVRRAEWDGINERRRRSR